MNQAKLNHTPEPWTIERVMDAKYPDELDKILIRGSDGNEVCCITVINDAEEIHGQKVDQANANMLAAAPMLYDACISMVAFISILHRKGSECSIPEIVLSPEGIPIKLGEIIAEAKAALAQAEGK